MSWYTRSLKQTLTYWAPGDIDGGGKRSYSPPVPLPCRWEDRRERFIDRNGNEMVSRAIAYVDADLQEGGYLHLGTSTLSTPTPSGQSYLINRFESDPDLSGRGDTVRRALM